MIDCHLRQGWVTWTVGDEQSIICFLREVIVPGNQLHLHVALKCAKICNVTFMLYAHFAFYVGELKKED